MVLNELQIYGSSRVGLVQEDRTVATPTNGYTATEDAFYRGKKRYELSNHLGNVMEVITDRKLIGTNGKRHVLFFDGASPERVEIPDATDLNFGTGDFTFESWINAQPSLFVSWEAMKG